MCNAVNRLQNKDVKNGHQSMGIRSAVIGDILNLPSLSRIGEVRENLKNSNFFGFSAFFHNFRSGLLLFLKFHALTMHCKTRLREEAK